MSSCPQALSGRVLRLPSTVFVVILDLLIVKDKRFSDDVPCTIFLSYRCDFEDIKTPHLPTMRRVI